MVRAKNNTNAHPFSAAAPLPPYARTRRPVRTRFLSNLSSGDCRRMRPGSVPQRPGWPPIDVPVRATSSSLEPTRPCRIREEEFEAGWDL